MDHRQPPSGMVEAIGEPTIARRHLLVGSCFPAGSRWRGGSIHPSLHAARVASHPVAEGLTGGSAPLIAPWSLKHLGHAGGHFHTRGQIDELVRPVSIRAGVEPTRAIVVPRENRADAAALEELRPRSRQPGLETPGWFKSRPRNVRNRQGDVWWRFGSELSNLPVRRTRPRQPA